MSEDSTPKTEDPRRTLAEIRDLLRVIDRRLAEQAERRAAPSDEMLDELRRIREAQVVGARASHKAATQSDFSLGRVVIGAGLVLVILFALGGYIAG